jgi:hypothetical protein
MASSILGLDGDLCALFGGLHTLDLGPGHHLDAALLVGFFELLADSFVFKGQEGIQHLDDGHLDAVGVPNGGKFDTDGTAADDHYRCGQGESRRMAVS